MLNRIYYLNDGNHCVGSEGRTASAEGITLIQCAGRGRTGVNELVERQFSADGNLHFCLGLKGSALEGNGQGDNGQELLTQARQSLLLFFHPFYETAVNGKPLFVFAPPQVVDGIRVPLTELFWRQRLAVELIVVNEDDGHGIKETGGMDGGKNGVLVLDAQCEDAGAAYYHYCLNAYRAEDIVLLKGSDIRSLAGPLRLAEDKLRREDPGFYRLADAGQQMRGTITGLSHRNGLYCEENAILQELLDLAVKHDEVTDILRFYKNEYEVLPLWYKRFGHIIKVLQGKRSFRSLYDKRVKKYKD